MATDIDLFDDVDFSEIPLGEEVTVEPVKVEVTAEDPKEETPVENQEKTPEIKDSKKQSKRTSKSDKLRQELKGVIENRAGDVEAQRREAEAHEKSRKAEIEARNANKIVIDAQNVDDRKTVQEYYAEGRIAVDLKDRPFILAPQPTKLYNPCKPPIHKILCEEIKDISIRKVYMDLEAMPVGSRTLIKTTIWARHQGYEIFSIISEEQLQYLLDNKFINKSVITYTFQDASTGGSFFLGYDGKEPSKEKIEALEQQEVSNYNLIHSKRYLSESTPVVRKEDSVETLEDVTIDVEGSEGATNNDEKSNEEVA